MDKIVKLISDQLARPASRGGFLSVAGKLAMGSAALAAGGIGALKVSSGVALALPVCCPGSACGGPNCPGTSKADHTYDSYCCFQGAYYQCINCYSQPSHDYVCTYSIYSSPNCPMGPVHH